MNNIIPNIPKITKQGKLSEFFPGLLRNLDELRSLEFPQLDLLKRVYADNCATTQEPKSVLEKIHSYKTGGLRGSNHSKNSDEAVSAQREYDGAKKKLKNFLQAKNYHLAFTSGTTGSSNLFATDFHFCPNDLLLISELEHNSQVVTIRNRAKQAGAEARYIPTILPAGRLDITALKSIINKRKKGKIVLMIVHVSNVTGVINPISEIKKLIGDRALIYLDLAQSAGHIPVNLDNLGVDFAGLSAHKMYGPMGIGAFLVRKDREHYLANRLTGGEAVQLVGKHDVAFKPAPERFEPGTQNIEGAIEWGYTIDFLQKIGMPAIEKHDRALGKYFLKELQKIKNKKIYGPPDFKNRIAIIPFNIGSSTKYEDVSKKLNARGISVRDGCFCAHLYLPRLLGVSETVHNKKIKRFRAGASFSSLRLKGAVRVSFSFYNTPLDVYKIIQAVKEISNTLRN